MKKVLVAFLAGLMLFGVAEAKVIKVTSPKIVAPKSQNAAAAPMVVIPGAGQKFNRVIMPSLGFGGGAAVLGIDYLQPMNSAMTVGGGLMLGIGNQYTVIGAQAMAAWKIGMPMVGIEAGYYSYSDTVSGITGISGNVEKGGKFGIGVTAGTMFGKILAQIGFNTALGLTAKAGYIF